MNQYQFAFESNPMSNDVHESSDAEVEWASAYLSHWLEESSITDSPRQRKLHGHGPRHHGRLHSSVNSCPSRASKGYSFSTSSTSLKYDDTQRLQIRPARRSTDDGYRSSFGCKSPRRVHFSKGDAVIIESSSVDTTSPNRSPSRMTSLSQHPSEGFPKLPFHSKSFDLGDIADPEDLIVEANLSKTLDVHDFVWVRRSNKTWTYSIVADFPIKSGRDKSVRLVLDKTGRTKTLKVKYWTKYIRLVRKREERL